MIVMVLFVVRLATLVHRRIPWCAKPSGGRKFVPEQYLGSVQVFSGRGSRSPVVEGDWDLRLHAADTTFYLHVVHQSPRWCHQRPLRGGNCPILIHACGRCAPC